MEKISSFLLSLALHAQILFLIIFWPAPAQVDLSRESYQVSLVLGDMGGEELTSAVLGARPEAIEDKLVASTENVEMPASVENQEVPTQENIIPIENLEEKAEPLPEKPQALPEPPKEVLRPEAPKIEEKPLPEEKELEEEKPEPEPKPEEKPKEPEKPKEEEKPKETPKPTEKPKEEPKPKPAPPAKPSSAALSALADLQKEVSNNPSVGGGAGSGSGAGGGGIYDVYMANVMLVVQSAWSIPIYSRENYTVQVYVQLDQQGKILNTRVEKSSGRADFDASALNALDRLGALPAPPNPDLQNIVIAFNSAQ